jgi:hypothetical protein
VQQAVTSTQAYQALLASLQVHAPNILDAASSNSNVAMIHASEASEHEPTSPLTFDFDASYASSTSHSTLPAYATEFTSTLHRFCDTCGSEISDTSPDAELGNAGMPGSVARATSIMTSILVVCEHLYCMVSDGLRQALDYIVSISWANYFGELASYRAASA